jgi:spoIIIJ-associated protein
MEIEKIKKIFEEVFKLIDSPIESIDYSFVEKRGHVFHIKSCEFEKLTANDENILKDTVYLLKRLFEKNNLANIESFKCTIDINQSQSKSDDLIKLKALKTAEEAKSLKTDIIMEQMSSYERMLVHSALSGQPDISTESIGEGKERRIKVKYLAI